MVTARGGQPTSAANVIAPAAFRASAYNLRMTRADPSRNWNLALHAQPAGRFSPLSPVGIGLIFLWDDVKTRSIQGS
jgi:hypothetical protein